MTSDDHQYGKGMDLAPQRAEHDFSRVLLKTIESIKHDPAQFRNLIYEMARVHLQREAWHRNPPMNILELRRMMLELETAIERVETASSQEDGVPRLSPPPQTEILNRGALGSLSAADSFVVIDHGPSSRTHRSHPRAAAIRAEREALESVRSVCPCRRSHARSGTSRRRPPHCACRPC